MIYVKQNRGGQDVYVLFDGMTEDQITQMLNAQNIPFVFITVSDWMAALPLHGE